MDLNVVYNEPCLETLRKMPNDFIDCVITSDPFMGTGTTAQVCIRSNRNFIGSEMSLEYINIFNINIKPMLNQIKLF